MEKYKVSIIIPVYNIAQYLNQCIDSILSQSFRDFECILVDDCSGDNSPGMCDKYAQIDPRIKVIHNTVNEGLVKSRKRGLEYATGDYIQFVDGDDWIEPDMTERLYQRAVSEGCDIVYCDLICFSEDGTLFHCKPFDSRGMKKTDIIINLIKDNFQSYIPNKFFARKLFNSIVYPDFQMREDAVVAVQLFFNAEKVGYEYSTLYHYRINQESISRSQAREKTNTVETFENFKKLDAILKKRSDYDLYKPAIMEKLAFYNERYNRIHKPLTGILKKAAKAVVPYGVLCMYQKIKDRHAKNV
jgi:glycosyltransferase involved in cell wall biosynthesis